MRSEQREADGNGPRPGDGPRRLVERLGPAGRWLRGRRSAPWRVAALAASASLAAAASLALIAPEARDLDWIDQGRLFAPDEVKDLLNGLAVEGIAAEADDQGRVGVDPERVADALKVLEKLKLARRSLRELVNDPARPPLWADSRERAELTLGAKAMVVQRALEEIPGILEAVVDLKPKAGGRSFAPPEVAGAGVRLRGETGRPIAPTTVERVLNVVTTFTELRPDDVTIIDAHGDALLRAGDPDFALGMRAEARARSWEAAIAHELARVVEGAFVEVRLEEPIASGLAAGAVAGDVEADPPPMAGAAVVPNGPMSLGRPDQETGDGRRGTGPDSIAGRVNVLVGVPASYVEDRFRAFSGGKEPRLEDLEPFFSFAQESIRTVVAHVIPEEAMRQPPQILMLPLPPEPARPQPAPRVARSWSDFWWVPAGAVGILAALALLASAGGWRPGRRPSGRPAATGAAIPRSHLPIRDDDAPGPADRVRELVRRDPAAAAAVLRRWVDLGADA